MKKKTLIISIIALFILGITAFAVFGANEKTLTVNIQYDGEVAVYVDNVYIGDAPLVRNVAKGAQVKLVNTSAEGFLYFSDSTMSTFGREGEYTFTILSDTALSAWYENTNQSNVCITYMNTNDTNQILTSRSFNAANIDSVFSDHLAEGANKFGYEFASWSMSVSEIKALVKNGAKNITVTPLYNAMTDIYTTNVEGGTFKSTGLKYSENKLNDLVTIVADDAPTGKKFAYWTNGQGAVIETKNEITLYVSGNETYTAVFVDKGQSVELAPSVSLATQYNASIDRIDSFVYRFCPEGYSVVTHGLVFAKERELTADQLTLDLVDGTTVKATSNGVPELANGVIVNHISVESCVSLRAYLTYRDANGEINTIYSDVIVASKPSDTPCAGGHDFSDYSREGDVMHYSCTRCTETKTEDLYAVVYGSVNKANAQKVANGLFEHYGYNVNTYEKATQTNTSLIVELVPPTAANAAKYGWTVSNDGCAEIYDSIYATPENVYDKFISAVKSAGGVEKVVSATFSSSLIATEENGKGNVYTSAADTVDRVESIYNTGKNNILTTPNTDLSDVVGTIYYVSNSGNDSASGMSPEHAWATLKNLNSVNLRAGDAVLFERGGVFRGYMNAVSGVTYGSYGDESLQKPVWVGSEQNYAGQWTEVENNIWKLNVTGIKNPGIIVFGADIYNNASDELVGTRVFDLETSGYAELDQNFEFYHGTPTLTYEEFNMDSMSYDLYVYYNGDLNRDFSSIEIGEDYTMLDVKTTNGVVVDNICFKYNGGHAINGGGNDGTRNVTVKNCVFGWVGGSAHIKAGSSKSITRYGNAIQIYGSVDGFYVSNNYIYEMFDTAITVQCGSTSSAAKDLYFANIYVDGNIIEKCFWGMEYWGYSSTEYVRAENINITNNYIGKTGACWGLMGHNNIKLSTALVIDSIGATGENAVIVADKVVKVTGNIFDRSYMIGYAGNDIDNGGGTKGYAIRLFQTKGDNAQRLYEFADNVFIQYNDQYMAKIEGDEHKTAQLDYAGLFDANTEEILLMYGAYEYMTGSTACVVTRPSDLNISE